MVDNIQRESYWDYMGRRLREERAKEEELMSVQLEEDDEGNLVLPLPTYRITKSDGLGYW